MDAAWTMMADGELLNAETLSRNIQYHDHYHHLRRNCASLKFARKQVILVSVKFQLTRSVHWRDAVRGSAFL